MSIASFQSVRAALGSFHPQAMPMLSRMHYRRELMAWMLLPLMMGAVEGGVASVIAKNAFAGVVPEGWLNLAVAILSGAPAFANVMSFLWASLSHGVDKIKFLVALQVASALLVGHVAFAPRAPVGLVMLIIGAVGARVCWAGVVTIRSTVWRANFPRHVRARMAGKLATVQAIMLAAVSLVIGVTMRVNDESYHAIFLIVAACGLFGALVYRRMRMRGHAALIADERRAREADNDPVGLGSLLGVWRVLRDDARYRSYMIAMWVFGIGNLMVSAPLVIMLKDEFGFGYLAGIMITATIPIALMPVSIPYWSRLLDGVHIVRFRVIHAWTFVAATTAVLVAAVTHEPAFLWLAAALKGVAIGGGVLGWNLGHHDFAPPALTSRYMGVHVTLTGLRGFIGPAIAVGLYEVFEAWSAGSGGWVFAVCLGLNLVGAAGFIRLARAMRAEEATTGAGGTR